MLNGVSLFSGVGGLELALHEEVKTVAYCEQDSYAQAVLIKRMQEGQLDSAPIFDDVRTFPSRQYVGAVDIVFGGFPCQDISVAGKGAGIKEGTRSGLWFEMLKIICEVRPTFVFLENVSAITGRGVSTVLSGLVETGYNCRWVSIRASDVGARHRRERWFCLAYTNSDMLRQQPLRCDTPLGKKDVAYSFHSCNDRGKRQCEGGKFPNNQFSMESQTMWDKDPADFDCSSESFVGRVADGIPQRVDRLKCLGNAVVPQQARKAWKILTNNL